MSDANATLREIYITGLKNAHAIETQAVELLSRQVERLQNYPEMEARARQHIDESKAQAQRLEEILHGLGSDYSYAIASAGVSGYVRVPWGLHHVLAANVRADRGPFGLLEQHGPRCGSVNDEDHRDPRGSTAWIHCGRS